MKIGVFDSGIGGLTVLKEIIDKYPNCEYIYYGDTLHLPYGEKTKKELLNLVSKIIEFFITQKVDLVVIACGTVSSTIYEELSYLYDIKMVNIITTAIDKIKKDKINKLAVLATKKTIDSHVFSKNLDSTDVIEIACPNFVPYLERNIGNINDILDETLLKVKEQKINNIVLGCTHYPLLAKDIKSYLGYDVNFYNLGKIVADTLNLTGNSFKLDMYFSFIDDNLLKNINKIIDKEKNIQKLVL